MVRRLLMAVFVALVISGAFTFLLAHKLAKQHPATLRYVTPVRNLEVGETVKTEDVRVTDWPSSVVIAGALLLPRDAVGHTVLSPLVSGQPIVAKQLSIFGGSGLSAKIRPGMRAISLRSDQVVGVAGFLLPGSHIDVLVTYRDPSRTDAVTATVLQDAEVLAAGQKTQADPDGKPSTVDVVTILVSPEAAERVVLASTQGTVHFVLRNGADQKQTEPGVTDIAALGLMRQPTPLPTSTSQLVPTDRSSIRRIPSKSIQPAAHPYRVLVVRGDQRTWEVFQ